MAPPIVLPRPSGPPLHVLAAALPRSRWPFLLDSGPVPAPLGRWSLLAFDPVEVLELRGADQPLAGGEDRALGRLGAALRRRFGEPAPVPREADDGEARPAFAGGAIGWLAYDLGRELERLPARARPDGPVPDLLAGLFAFALAEDRVSGRRLIVGRGRGAEAAAFAREVDALERTAGPVPPPAPVGDALERTFDRDGYVAAVQAVREHILAGDVYQVNLSQRYAAPWEGEPAALHAALRVASPAPFSACLRTPGASVVSSSPELFLRRRGERLLSRPIKGTRPRGASPGEDAALRAELEASAKERAELAMIVDLVRNDLGRSARLGSVEVGLPFETDAWSCVFHRVAEVRARLPAGADATAVIEAAFPPASVTGTPKIRAQEVIESLEPVRRHVYTGALGWIDAGGDCDLSVAIRIATHVEGRLLVNVGGGITLASDPVAEYEETLHKGRDLFDVLGLPRAPRPLGARP